MAHWNGLEILSTIFVGLIILFLIFSYLQKRKKHQHEEFIKKHLTALNNEAHDDGILSPVRIIPTEHSLEQAAQEIAPEHNQHLPSVLTLFIKAKPHQMFYGYELLQAILSQGFMHGSMHFFHYYNGQKTLFTLASCEAPGTFELDQMGQFKTTGICIFMQPQRFANPVPIFDKMLNTAQLLCDDLGGTLEDEHQHLLTTQRANYWRALLEEMPTHE